MFGTAASFAGIQKRLNASIRNCATNSQTRLSTIGIDAKSEKRMTSVTTIVLRRSHRSAMAPARGPRTIAGSNRNSRTPPRAKLAAANPSTSEVAVAVIARSPSQSPKLDSDIDSHSLRKSRTRSTARSFAARLTAPRTPGGAPSPGCPWSAASPSGPACASGSSSVSGTAASGGTVVPADGRPSAGRAIRSAGCASTVSSGSGAGGVGSDGIRAPVGRRGGGGSPSAGSRYRAHVTIPAELRPSGGAAGVRGAADDRPGTWIGSDTATGAERSTDTARPRQQGGAAAAWDPKVYRRFGNERTRPFLDLLARVGAQDPSVVVDLGCGEGRATAVLAQRWPGARVIGV